MSGFCGTVTNPCFAGISDMVVCAGRSLLARQHFEQKRAVFLASFAVYVARRFGVYLGPL
jgi:hypothetical protein